MPPRARRTAAPKPLTIGVIGSGELAPKALNALLDDLGEVELVYVPVSADDFTDEVATVVKWAVANDIPYETISDGDAENDKALKKIIDAARDDFPPTGELSVGETLVTFLAGDEDNPAPDNPRLYFFFDEGQEYDVAVFEAAAEAGVPCFDFLDAGGELTFAKEEPEPEPEPEKPARGRRGAAKAKEEPEPDDEAADAAEVPTEAELKKMTLVELKKIAKSLDPKNITTETLRGLKAPDVIELITEFGSPADAEEPEEPADEAQQTAGRRTRSKAKEEAPPAPQDGEEPADEPEEGEDPKEAVFARLRGSREQAERIAHGMAAVAREQLGLEKDAEQLEVAAGILAAGLMAFAEYLIVEVRKPKSAGRPRKDGSEARPKEETPAPAPRRRRS